MITDEQYKQYDEIVACSLDAIREFQEKFINTELSIYYVPNDDYYEYLLQIALMWQDIFGQTIYIYTNIFNYIKLKIKHRKRKIKWLVTYDATRIVDFSTISYKISQKHNARLVVDVYNTYYKEKK